MMMRTTMMGGHILHARVLQISIDGVVILGSFVILGTECVGNRDTSRVASVYAGLALDEITRPMSVRVMPWHRHGNWLRLRLLLDQSVLGVHIHGMIVLMGF